MLYCVRIGWREVLGRNYRVFLFLYDPADLTFLLQLIWEPILPQIKRVRKNFLTYVNEMKGSEATRMNLNVGWNRFERMNRHLAAGMVIAGNQWTNFRGKEWNTRLTICKSRQV